MEGTLGPVDVLVANATGPQPEAPLGEVGWDDHLDQLAFFVKSPLLLGRAVVPGMRERGTGGSSTSTRRWPTGRRRTGRPTRPPRAREIGLARSWARELAPHGITVNTVAPGFVPVERHADVDDADRLAYVATVPAGRFGTVDEIAHAVSFFASEEAGFVTGQRLVVDGGRSLG